LGIANVAVKRKTIVTCLGKECLVPITMILTISTDKFINVGGECIYQDSRVLNDRDSKIKGLRAEDLF
jgi:hypothetical protein